MASWVAELTNEGLAPATVQKAYQTLAKVLRAAVDADLIADTPCRRIRLPKVEADEMRFLSPDEIEVLTETMAPRYRALVLFDAYCGLRLSELAGLRRGAVDLRRRRCPCRAQRRRGAGQGRVGCSQDPRPGVAPSR